MTWLIFKETYFVNILKVVSNQYKRVMIKSLYDMFKQQRLKSACGSAHPYHLRLRTSALKRDHHVPQMDLVVIVCSGLTSLSTIFQSYHVGVLLRQGALRSFL